MPYHCGMCNQSFNTRGELDQHAADHADNTPATLTCPWCPWSFPDSLALEQHQIVSGHQSAQFACDTCGDTMVSQQGLNKHLNQSTGCQKASSILPAAQASNGASHEPTLTSTTAITCDRCPRTFRTQREYNAHRKFPDGDCADHKKRTPPRNKKRSGPAGCVDLVQPHQTVNGALGYHDASDTPDDLSEDNEYCHECKTAFKSKAGYNAHALRCTSQTMSNGRPSSSPKISQVAAQYDDGLQPTLTPVRKQSLDAKLPAAPAIPSFRCIVQECGKAFRSEPGLKAHQADVHGLGGKALDLQGSQSFMMNQRVREQLKVKGLLRDSPRAPIPPPRPFPAPTPAQIPIPMPTGMSMGGEDDIKQAKYIQGKIGRLRIQSDIFIHNNGKMTVCGIDWTRIAVSNQNNAITSLDGMCSLPKSVQGEEYLLPPTAFKDEYKVAYPVTDFKHSPDRDSSKPGLGVIALSCGKILLADGRQEVVKIAAVDLVTSRILMNHLVCTDPYAKVANWRSSVTGLSGWDDMEGARKAGYKIFKGWSSARSALWKFVDKETIVVGHNLRSDLDVLRMIHGRAVDIAIVVEKAAKGPLSKPQLSLDSICRTYLSRQLVIDPQYGRDFLMNAFAAREFGLWAIKNPEILAKDAKQKSLDYQRVIQKPVTTA
ncbi:uncharacterized protein K460DRAFT_324763 [Cucurbitaria berberidis CBS 394.84]|uniref:C2H2-type domain-containing protein n=1 Tax=Cucurbitaria berberidis CBS 394.84 TaxID=1168544 RepID=A0A9P4GVA7_9PLEO|nr:uncharacterized protein K460DRAFT_324763 [Cucurbitaria berberidis CBS 394.84]KAF1851666.1 hypothetical protein K460DRAFT_324763 [Cucurbitaria berberidis CBS 394.84]